MIKNILTLTLNDIAIAVKNKTIFLVFFIPLFVFGIMKLVDKNNQPVIKMNLALVKNETYPPVIVQSLKAADKVIELSFVENIDEGKALIKKKKIKGLLLKTEELIVLKKESLTTLSIIETLNTIQLAAAGKKNWVQTISPIQSSDLQKESLPTWILMLALLVGFVIMPSQVAEEKEKKLLLSLLQTPMRESEWLLAKVLTGIIMTFTSVIFLHTMGSFKGGLNFSYILMIFLGSFCFTSYGIFLGFLCRNQASARILGVVFYLPHLLPSALADFSHKLSVVAPLLPSFHLFESVKLILFENVRINALGMQSMYLFLIGLATLAMSYFLMKRRWLM